MFPESPSDKPGYLIEFRPGEVQYFYFLFNEKADRNIFTPAE